METIMLWRTIHSPLLTKINVKIIKPYINLVFQIYRDSFKAPPLGLHASDDAIFLGVNKAMQKSGRPIV